MKKTKITDYIPNTIDYKYSDILDNNYVSLEYFACFSGSQIWLSKSNNRYYLRGRYLPDEVFSYTKTLKMSSAIEACHILKSFDSFSEAKCYFKYIFDFLANNCHRTDKSVNIPVNFELEF